MMRVKTPHGHAGKANRTAHQGSVPRQKCVTLFAVIAGLVALAVGESPVKCRGQEPRNLALSAQASSSPNSSAGAIQGGDQLRERWGPGQRLGFAAGARSRGLARPDLGQADYNPPGAGPGKFSDGPEATGASGEARRDVDDLENSGGWEEFAAQAHPDFDTLNWPTLIV